jgi:ABC-type lipoprotein release transport system permease subunit
VLLLTLAVRNVVGGGLRTWLNAVALSFSFVVIILLQGIYDGMNRQAERASVGALYGGGQYWQARYDPYDPLTLPDAHAPIPTALDSLIRHGQATPILIREATIYPRGHFRAILLKGITPDQNILTMPTAALQRSDSEHTMPALIGTRMASSVGLKQGDDVTVQWRDVHGTFDAADATIVQVMRTTVPEIDNGQIWVPLDRLQRTMDMAGQATVVVLRPGADAVAPADVDGWTYRDLAYLLRDLRALVRSKSIGASILYVVLLFLAMLAIFDTQVLSIFRRRKEIGTLLALGMTRTRVIGLFTTEGAMHGVFAALLALAYGFPLLALAAAKGYPMPGGTDQFGLALGERIFPVYPAALVVGTTLLVLVVTTIVSFLPTRRIAKLKPTDALRGRLT